MPSLPSGSNPSSSPDPPSSPPDIAPATTTSRTSSSSSSPEIPSRFPPSEEASLLSESNQLKASANTTFTRGDFSTAIAQYDKAIASCPNYLDYEIAVLRSNIAACHLKLEDWKAAVAAADAALAGIERVTAQQSDGRQTEKQKKTQQQQDSQKEEEDGSGDEEHTNHSRQKKDNNNDDADTTVVELDPTEDETAALRHLQEQDERHRAIARIKAKSLMRRARAKSQLGGWANLQAAQDDYAALSTMSGGAEMPLLPPQDRKVVQAALKELPARVARAREAEMGEMMGKLKELGNSVLKPFGLSTDMFKMQKDEKTGGYSMSINQEN